MRFLRPNDRVERWVRSCAPVCSREWSGSSFGLWLKHFGHDKETPELKWLLYSGSEPGWSARELPSLISLKTILDILLDLDPTSNLDGDRLLQCLSGNFGYCQWIREHNLLRKNSVDGEASSERLAQATDDSLRVQIAYIRGGLGQRANAESHRDKKRKRLFHILTAQLNSGDLWSPVSAGASSSTLPCTSSMGKTLAPLPSRSKVNEFVIARRPTLGGVEGKGLGRNRSVCFPICHPETAEGSLSWSSLQFIDSAIDNSTRRERSDTSIAERFCR